jgi:vacuolar iron transporter family protein
VASSPYLIPLTVVTSLLCLIVLGALSAAVAGANMKAAALRMAVWSALAMGVTAGVGSLIGAIG